MLCVFLGPNLPKSFTDYYDFGGFKMITSPTGNGVVIFGGRYHNYRNLSDESDENIELTGDSIDTLKWNVISNDEVDIYISFLKKFQLLHFYTQEQ